MKTGYSLGKMEERGRIMAEGNVIVVSFEEEAKAYQAASVLRQADVDGRIDVHAVAIVQRMEDGTLRVKKAKSTISPPQPGQRRPSAPQQVGSSASPLAFLVDH